MHQEDRPDKRPKLAALPTNTSSRENLWCTRDPLDPAFKPCTHAAHANIDLPCENEQLSPREESETNKVEHDFMDATENKKLRRKQSNRESARRSRLRKQAECEALTSTVTELQQENCHLKAANKAMVQQIEELAAKLEEKSQKDSCIFRPLARTGAFKPVLPSSKIGLSLESGLNGLINSR